MRRGSDAATITITITDGTATDANVGAFPHACPRDGYC
jgi:hypothetical protein